AETLCAGGAGAIRITPFEERRIHAEQVISPEGQINTGGSRGTSRVLREIEVLGTQLNSSHDRRRVGSILGTQYSKTLRFFPLLRRHRLRPQPFEESAFLWSDLRRFFRLVHFHMRSRCRLAFGRSLGLC